MRAADLARALGAKRSGRQFVCRCPAHDDKTPSLIFWDGETAIRFRCFSGCEPIDIIAALRRKGLWHTGEQQRKQANDRRSLALEIWAAARGLNGTAAQYYLALRKLWVPPDYNGAVARFHPRCPRSSERVPALVVLFRSIRDDVPMAVQRIFVTRDYRKDGKPMMLGPAGDAAMKLGKLGPKLTICEGFETALALHCEGYAPVWALGSAGAIERFPIIDGVEKLIVATDNDPPGIAASNACVETWGERAEAIMVVGRDGADFADYALELGEEL